MAGWHPGLPDGGMPANPGDPNNPSQAFLPSVPPNFTAPTYYGNGCDVRLRPHVINALISNNLNILDRVGLAYNPGSFANTRTAIEYIVQKGLPKYSVVAPQGTPPYYYRGTLDPAIQGAPNNGMVLCIVPTEANRGFVRLDVGYGYWIPVLRNDGAELEREDWLPGVPVLLGYHGGAWWSLGLSKSQVPIVLKGAINFWIRPDGNDQEGDGTENTPEKAFRTIAGAWWAVGNRYAGSPGAAIVFRLGIPGTYEGAEVGPFGSAVHIIGDENNAINYRIITKVNFQNAEPLSAWSIYGGGVNWFAIHGVNLVMTYPLPTWNGCFCLRCNGCSTVTCGMMYFSVETNNTGGGIILSEGGSGIFSAAGNNVVRGNNHTIGQGFSCGQGTIVGNGIGPVQGHIHWENLNFIHSGYSIGDRSFLWHSNCIVSVFNCTGRRYNIGGWSNMQLEGQPAPGNQPGQAGPDANVWL